MKKIAITGSRNIKKSQKLLDLLNDLQPDEIISGGAIGADKIAEDWAKMNGKKITIIRPDYEKYESKIAPIIRNKEIVEKADHVIAIWDGKSKGTAATIKMAKNASKLLKVIFEID